MKKLIFIFLFLTTSVFAQSSQTAPSVPFANYKTAAQILSLPCTKKGTFVFDTTNGVWKYCSATGNPGTWSSFGGGGGTGLLELNGLTTDPQTFAVGTSGTNFNIVSSGSTHTFNFPNASGTNRGLLTSADWTTFNNKGDALTSGNLSQFASTTSAQLAGIISNETGSGALVFGTSPTLTTPSFSSIVNTGTLTLPTSTDTLVGRATTDTLTNKTLTAPVFSGTITGTYTLGGTPTFPSSVALLTAAQTLTNKTLTSPVINVGSDATGDIYYRDSGGLFARLGVGTNGQVLTLSGGLPSWQNASGGGASSPLTLTASTSSEIPLSIVAASSQSANLFNITSSGGSAGDLFNISAAGTVFVRRDSSACSVQALGTSGGTSQCIRFHDSNLFDFLINNSNKFRIGDGTVQIPSNGEFYWNSSTANNSSNDTGFKRFAAGVIAQTNGGSGITGLSGGGAAVASAAALPLPTGRLFHVTGTTNITSITSTNFQSGVCITLIFDGVLTLTDGNNLKLAGNFTTAADATWSGCYDGTNWFETSRSTN